MGNNFSAQRGRPFPPAPTFVPNRMDSPRDTTMWDVDDDVAVSPDDTEMPDVPDEELEVNRSLVGSFPVESTPKVRGKRGTVGGPVRQTGKRRRNQRRVRRQAAGVTIHGGSGKGGDGGDSRIKSPVLPDGKEHHQKPSKSVDEPSPASEDTPPTHGRDRANSDVVKSKKFHSLRTAFNPEWNTSFPLRTEKGLPNQGTVCYRNVTLQILLHAPVFLNWLAANQQRHAPRAASVCSGSKGSRTGLSLLWPRVFDDWDEGSHDGHQDAVEFWLDLLRQFTAQTKPLQRPDLDAIFSIPTVNMIKCQSGACTTKYKSDQTNFLTLQFPADTRSLTSIDEMITSFFSANPIEETGCPDCSHARLTQECLGRPPELLLVHLNRIRYRDGELQKIDRKATFRETIELDRAVFDPRLAAADDVEYQLSSVILHRGRSTQSGHYRIVVRGRAGQWSLLDDESAPRHYDSFEDFASGQSIQSEVYLLAYRRLCFDPQHGTTGTTRDVSTAEGDNLNLMLLKPEKGAAGTQESPNIILASERTADQEIQNNPLRMNRKREAGDSAESGSDGPDVRRSGRKKKRMNYKE
ncbi:hypothetical protein N7492_009306 [Penicillium capsulatum]|uniref:ubiquitinyl hydrolase 1 n=1 Tax=Penicillium capsulatum TaxID=69766 RepID=A0A9W9HRF3_9EURO|nr:hypothetical protein N7492_009306 [Penicillium capsulatum]